MTGMSFFTSLIDRVVAGIEILTSNIVWLFFAFRADNLPRMLQSGSFLHTVLDSATTTTTTTKAVENS
jgi:hypothetical protein